RNRRPGPDHRGLPNMVMGVRTVQRAQDLPIAIVEEIAFENGWITLGQLMESAERYGKSPYGQHLKGLTDGEVMLVPNQKN
ncbi:hypothetical protein ACJ8MS_10760, partial [Bifidobacterium longum subsp. longum]